MSEEKKTAEAAEEKDNRPIDDGELEEVSGGVLPLGWDEGNWPAGPERPSRPTFRRYRR